MSDFIEYSFDEGIVTLTLSAPDQHNALSHQTQFDAFADVCGRINRDRRVSVVILTGAGKSFCAGGNVKDMKARTGLFAGSPYELRDGYRHGIQQIPLSVYHLEVPTIAAVNGAAIGAGCDLALMCDIRIASQQARFAESFVRLGIVPGDGGAWLLPRALNNLSRAYELSFTGDTISAQQALEYGLVSRVVEPDALMATALDLARRIAANPGHALRLTKKLLREGQHTRLEPLLELSAAYQALSHHTEAHQAIVQAL
ncbi:MULTISPECIES: crotonase/enoyl-CoA hydratase family protein [Pseudomonas]|uniref:crotonase/enoyl-CoA hydratase family protein n=1 Tax=Pseudomonas TaxID=286 RepID=UPI00224B4763|nr:MULTISPECIES: crotonase/enoyl-CoA hydratase family protein [unclassified Pseudomonas]MCX2887777.1 crotonase/enoyl-CoA hydratase family protein [Pseudomonas sp. DCB_BI]MDH4550375.1 crotonase/enoyl-CoA hydratase family protein [Pseudomonas sp. BN607]